MPEIELESDIDRCYKPVPALVQGKHCHSEVECYAGFYQNKCPPEV